MRLKSTMLFFLPDCLPQSSRYRPTEAPRFFLCQFRFLLPSLSLLYVNHFVGDDRSFCPFPSICTYDKHSDSNDTTTPLAFFFIKVNIRGRPISPSVGFPHASLRSLIHFSAPDLIGLGNWALLARELLLTVPSTGRFEIFPDCKTPNLFEKEQTTEEDEEGTRSEKVRPRRRRQEWHRRGGRHSARS